MSNEAAIVSESAELTDGFHLRVSVELVRDIERCRSKFQRRPDQSEGVLTMTDISRSRAKEDFPALLSERSSVIDSCFLPQAHGRERNKEQTDRLF